MKSKKFNEVEIGDFIVEHNLLSGSCQLFKVSGVFQKEHVQRLRTVKLERVNFGTIHNREKIITISSRKLHEPLDVYTKGQYEYYPDTKIAIRKYQRILQARASLLKDMSKTIKKGD